MSEKIRIVIVDDHQMFIDGLKGILEPEPNISIMGTAHNGIELLKLLENTATDIILLDVNMPEMNGIEATKEIVKLYPSIKIIMLTMFDTSDYIQKVLKAGAHGYILKNTGKAELLEAIKTVNSGQSFFSNEVTKTIMAGLQNKPKQVNNTMEVELTDREIDVLKLIAQELTTNEIGEKLFISKHTVETHRKNLISKLNVRNVVGLVKYAVEKGYTED